MIIVVPGLGEHTASAAAAQRLFSTLEGGGRCTARFHAHTATSPIAMCTPSVPPMRARPAPLVCQSVPHLCETRSKILNNVYCVGCYYWPGGAALLNHWSCIENGKSRQPRSRSESSRRPSGLPLLLPVSASPLLVLANFDFEPRVCTPRPRPALPAPAA